MKYGKELDDQFYIRSRFMEIWELGKLFLILTVIVNLIGCGFYFITLHEDYSWIQYKNIQDLNWVDKYIISIYFASITMLTVGYGDYTPVTTTEIIYVIVVTFCATTVFAYTVNVIGQILTNKSEKVQILKEKQFQTKIYLQKRNISQDLQIKILKYIEYIYHSKSNLLGQQSLDIISKDLKEKFYYEFFAEKLKAQSMLKTNFSDKFLNKLAQKMKESQLYPGDYLLQENQVEPTLFIITGGTVAIQEKSRIIKILEKKNQMINSLEFFSDQTPSQSVVCQTTVTYIYLQKSDFDIILKDFNIDFQRYSQMRDKISLYNQKFNNKCFFCNNGTHTYQKCPLIKPQFNNDLLIKKNNFSAPQPRIKSIKRNSGRKKNQYSALMHREYLSHIIKEIKCQLINLFMLNDDEDYINIQSSNYINNIQREDQLFQESLPSMKFTQQNQLEIVYEEMEDDNDFNFKKQESINYVNNQNETIHLNQQQITIDNNVYGTSNIFRQSQITNQNSAKNISNGSNGQIKTQNQQIQQQPNKQFKFFNIINQDNQQILIQSKIGESVQLDSDEIMKAKLFSFSDESMINNNINNIELNKLNNLGKSQSFIQNEPNINPPQNQQKLIQQKIFNSSQQKSQLYQQNQLNLNKQKILTKQDGEFKESQIIDHRNNTNVINQVLPLYYDGFQMDISKSYKFYFPHNNQDEVLKANKASQIKILSLLKRKSPNLSINKEKPNIFQQF